MWLADLEQRGATGDGALSASERERAARIAAPERGRLWARSRAILRELLGAYLGLDPADVPIELSERGKPMIGRPGRPAGDGSRAVDLRFSLSHSGPLALYAVTLGAEVGVDVELGRRPLDEPALAARALGEAQASRLRALEPAARRREFLRAWVAHEARVKCLGTGLAGAEPALRAGGGELWLAQLEVGREGAAAVAMRTGPHAVRQFMWRKIVEVV